MNGDALLDGLNPQQLAAVTSDGGPVVVMAAAGSGKTRVLTRRIAWRVASGQTNPDRVLALTFSRKAAEELRHRQLRLGQRDQIMAGTFHAIALHQLRQRWAEKRRPQPKILESKRRLLRTLLKELSPKAAKGNAEALLTNVTSEVDWAQARLVAPTDYDNAAQLAQRTPPLDGNAMEQLLTSYQQTKRKKGVIDFDDLLLLAIDSMRRDPGYAAAIRWRFQHLYIDEFQDVNPLQNELLNEWRNQSDDVFIVGDPNQAIYGWNGADPELLNRFSDREPTASVHYLTENYRSNPHILRLAKTVLTNPASAPTAFRSGGAVPTLRQTDDDEAEAQIIAATIRDNHGAERWSDQAVLARTRAQLKVIQTVLTEAGIPAKISSGDSPLNDAGMRTELKALTQPSSDLAQWCEQTQELLSEPRDGLPALERKRRTLLHSLLRLVGEYLRSDPNPTGPGLSSWIGLLKDEDLTDDRDAVTLLTFHSCKGLEWPSVHIAGLEKGYVPIAYADNGAQKSEEQRLLYVALTRAQDRLHLTWASKRNFGNRSSKRTPSPYIPQLEQAIRICENESKHQPDWRQSLTQTRSNLDTGFDGTTSEKASAKPTDPGDDRSEVPTEETNSEQELTARKSALEQWRTTKARANNVDQSLVIDDVTLDDIAAANPETAEQLRETTSLPASKVRRYAVEILKVLGSL